MRIYFVYLWCMLIVMRQSAIGSTVAPFDAYHELCGNIQITKLVNLTQRTNCEDFLLHEVIPSPLSLHLYSGATYHRLSSNLVRAVHSGVLRVGVLGGSISGLWVTPFKELANLLFAQIGNSYNGIPGRTGTLVQVMNGAIGGTGALVPSGCAVSLLGEINLDVIVLEFAINDKEFSTLQTLVRVLSERYVNAAIVLLELTSCMHKDILHETDGWPAGEAVAREFHLPYVNWSQPVDRGYNTTFDPLALWKPGAQHPNLLGSYWMAMSVVETLETVYRHRIGVANGSEAFLLPAPSDYHPRVSHPDTLCISEFCMGSNPRDLLHQVSAAQVMRTKFDSYGTAGSCWKTHVFAHSENASCHRFVRQYNDSDCPQSSADNSHVYRLNVTIQHDCQLHIAVVGGGATRALLQCNMDVFTNDFVGSNATLLGQVRLPSLTFIAQTPVAVAPLRAGLHSLSIVPVKVPGKSVKEDVCNLSSIFCVPIWVKTGV